MTTIGGGEPIDVETSTLPEHDLKQYIVNEYARRDQTEFTKTGVNLTVYMIKKAKTYGIQVSNEVVEYAQERSFKKFYSSFTLGELSVLGY